MADPVEHFAALKRMLKYLSKIKEIQLKYCKTGNPSECYIHADWRGDAIDRKSYTGYIFLLADAAFSRGGFKQQSVALSSTKTEYMALYPTAKEETYIGKLLKEIQLHNKTVIIIQGDESITTGYKHHLSCS